MDLLFYESIDTSSFDKRQKEGFQHGTKCLGFCFYKKCILFCVNNALTPPESCFVFGL